MADTTLTIIGMIAAFLTASITPIITESVKNHNQHKKKIHNLRTALYKEIWSNVITIYNLRHHINAQDLDSNDPERLVEEIYLQKHAFRNECYKDVLQNDMITFYELEEAATINALQGVQLGILISLIPTDTNRVIEMFAGKFGNVAKTYNYKFVTAIHSNCLHKGILNTFIKEQDFKDIDNRAAEDWKRMLIEA